MNLLFKYFQKTSWMDVLKIKNLLGKKWNNFWHSTDSSLFQKLLFNKVLISIKLNGCLMQPMKKIKIISREKMNLFGFISSSGFLKT